MIMTTTPETRTEEPAAKAPRIDLRSLFDRLRVPGIDTKKLTSLYRKDIEAVLAANERVFNAVESLTRKQVEIFVNAAKEWNDGAREAISDSSAAEKLNKASARIEKAFTNAFSNMREMAEISAKSTEDVISILNKRYRDGLEDFRGSLKTKA
jgi:phasin family protein